MRCFYLKKHSNTAEDSADTPPSSSSRLGKRFKPKTEAVAGCRSGPLVTVVHTGVWLAGKADGNAAHDKSAPPNGLLHVNCGWVSIRLTKAHNLNSAIKTSRGFISLKKKYVSNIAKKFYLLFVCRNILQKGNGNTFPPSFMQSVSVQAPAPYGPKTPVNDITRALTSLLFCQKHCH